MIIIATLTDVAKLANVSKMTVSRVINHPEKVTEELKELVHNAMEQLNYTPNRVAQALAHNRTNMVKVVILEEMDVVEPYYMTLLTGIAKELNHYQYAVRLIENINHDDGDADGYIVMGMREHDYEWLSSITKPVILYGENDKGFGFVDTNNEKSVQTATNYALERYEHCVYIGIDIQEPFEMKRQKGFENAMTQAQRPYQIYKVDNRSRYAKALVEQLLQDGIPKNTCFVCSTDRIGLGVLRALKESNCSIPLEYGVTGFDGVFLDRIALPNLTTMRQPLIEMGKACAKELMKKINQADYTIHSNYFDATLIIAESTK